MVLCGGNIGNHSDPVVVMLKGMINNISRSLILVYNYDNSS